MAAGRGGRTQVRAVPEGKIRQSQVVTTFGPGAMVDLIDQAVHVGGLDFWFYGPGNKAETIQEPRLRDAVAERFRQAGRELSVELAFREPPVGDEKNASPGTGIKVFELPQWFVCQGPDCRALLGPNGLERKSGRLPPSVQPYAPDRVRAGALRLRVPPRAPPGLPVGVVRPRAKGAAALRGAEPAPPRGRAGPAAPS